MTAVTLRDYQLAAVDSVLQHHEDGVRRQLAVLPTGGGKTVVFSAIAKAIDGPTLVLAHRDELLDQAIAKLGLVWPEAEVGKLRADVDESDAHVVVASVATASRDRRLDKLADRQWSTVIVDEAHHAPARSYVKVLNRVVGPETLLLGVTATPGRLDGQALGQVFDDVTVRVSIDDLVAQGYLVDCRLRRVVLEDLDMRDVTVSSGDYSTGDLGRRLASAGLAPQLARVYHEHGERRPAVVYVPTVDLAHDVAAAMTSTGYPCGVVSGETPVELRQSIFHQLRTGELCAVANCMVLTEGWDEPCVSCVIVARPTRSTSLYQQMVGRGLRPHPSKDDCLVIDVSGVDRDPAQATLCDLGGDGQLAGKQLEVVREMIRLLDEGKTLQEAKAGAVKRFGDEDERAALSASSGRQRDAFRWLRSDRGWWVLTLGDKGVIVLFPRSGGAAETWAAAHLEARPAWEHKKAAVKELARDVPLEWSQGIAEELVRRYGSAKVSAAQAGWRDSVASEGQRNYARLCGLTDAHFPEDGGIAHVGKGPLSDAITLAAVSRRFDAKPMFHGIPLVDPKREGPQGSSDGTWRTQPATEAQRAYAGRLGLVEPAEGWTKGGISKAIDEAKASKASKPRPGRPVVPA